jgi:hypothetical protein
MADNGFLAMVLLGTLPSLVHPHSTARRHLFARAVVHSFTHSFVHFIHALLLQYWFGVACLLSERGDFEVRVVTGVLHDADLAHAVRRAVVSAVTMMTVMVMMM